MFTIPAAMQFTDWSLLLLRIVVALVFGSSGFNHLKSPKERAASIGMSLPFTILIGAAELAGAIALVVGVLTQWAALGLIVIMLGAMYKKIFEWKTGFWGEKSMGWHYEVLFIAMLLVIVTTGGGRIALMR
ncbi:MAG: DoxX family protein [Terracidiphilus sp.]